MRVRIMQDMCGTAGMCVKICPEIFRFQEGSKKAEVLIDRVPPHLIESCRKALDSCPNRAIVMFSD